MDKRTIVDYIEESPQNTNKAILNQMLDEFADTNGSGGAGADWEQNDPTAKDYVKNRTHYKRTEKIVIVEGFETETYEQKGELYLTNTIIHSNYMPTAEEMQELRININAQPARIIASEYSDTYGQWVTSDGIIVTYGGKPTWHVSFNQKRFDVLPGQSFVIDIYAKQIQYIPLDEKYLPSSVLEQPDWKCNNTDSSAHIKNRTHYDYWVFTDNCIYNYDSYYNPGHLPYIFEVVPDENDFLGGHGFFYNELLFNSDSDWKITGEEYDEDLGSWKTKYECQQIKHSPHEGDGDEILTMTAITYSQYDVDQGKRKYFVNIDCTFRGTTGGIVLYEAEMRSKTLDKRFLADFTVVKDWSVNDENDSGYINNRTHYPYKGPGTFIYGERYEFNGEHNEFITQGSLPYEQIIESDLSENEAPGYWLGSMGGYYLSGYESLIADAYSDWRRVDTIDDITSYRCGNDGSLSVEVNVQPIGSNSYRVILTRAWTDFSDYGYQVYTLGLKYKQLDEVYLPDTVAREPNWEENNPYSPSYIKNRPFYVEYSRVEPYEPIYHPMNEKFIPDTIARVTDIPAMDTTLISEGAAADAKAVGEAISNLIGDLESLTWSDLGENVISEEQLVFRDDDFVGVSTYDGIEGTSLSVGDTCKVILSGDILLPGLKSECIVTIDENYSFTIMGYSDGFKMTYNNETNQYKFERIGEQPLPVGTISIIKLGQVEVTEIDEKYIPDTIARAPKAVLEDVTEAPTAEQYNALLAILRQAGILAT